MKKLFLLIVFLVITTKAQIASFDFKPLITISNEIGHQYSDDRMFPTLGIGVTKNVEHQELWLLSQFEVLVKIARHDYNNIFRYNDNLSYYNYTIGINNIKRLGEFAGLGYHFDIGSNNTFKNVIIKYGVSVTTMDLRTNLSIYYERISNPLNNDKTSGFVGLAFKINPSDYFNKHK